MAASITPRVANFAAAKGQPAVIAILRGQGFKQRFPNQSRASAMNAKKTLSARDFMSDHLVTFLPDMRVLDAIHLLVEKQISGAPVVDARGNLVGILTERDCIAEVLGARYHGQSAGLVKEFMSRDVESVETDTSLVDIAKNFVDSKYRRYPVMDNNRLVGIISRRDILRAVLDLS